MSKTGILGVEEIKKLLPHREPFLMLDRVLSLDANKGVAVKDVTGKEDFFKGHFPDYPIMPGVLILEAMAQLTGVIWYYKAGRSDTIAFLAGIDKARFRAPVRPGDVLKLEVEIVKKKNNLIVAEGRAKVGDKLVCEGKLMSMIS
jgi:3-hydroxyacyl-[acyl-carrier-protein] dehydratase